MRKFFSNRRLVMIVVALVVAFGLMGGSVTLRNNRLTPPLIQQFGNVLCPLDCNERWLHHRQMQFKMFLPTTVIY